MANGAEYTQYELDTAKRIAAMDGKLDSILAWQNKHDEGREKMNGRVQSLEDSRNRMRGGMSVLAVLWTLMAGWIKTKMGL